MPHLTNFVESGQLLKMSANQVQRSITARPLVIGLLLIMFAQLSCGARHLSLTSDEPSHIVAGITYLDTGELWIPPLHGHPPLVNVLAAWPLLLQSERPAFSTLPGWKSDFSTYVRAAWPLLGPVERLAFMTRLPIMLMAVLLTALVFRQATDLFGQVEGVLAVVLMVFDPNMLAHSQLDTTDLGLTFFGFAGIYVIWNAMLDRRPKRQWGKLLIGGTLLGLAMAGKGSGVLYIPPALMILVWNYIPIWLSQRRLLYLGRLVNQGILLCLTAFIVLWGVYGFRIGSLSGSSLLWPFPAHLELWRTVLQDVKRAAFLRGETKVGGWWWYFPYSMAIKTPLPLLIALVLSVWIWMRKERRRWWQTLPLLIFPALYWVIAIRSKMNIGYRHMLPTFPFMYVFIGQAAKVFRSHLTGKRSVICRALAIILMGWYVIEAIKIYPFYIAYFNQLVGGPQQGYRHLVDSNVDWGQSFIELRRYMDREAIEDVFLSYYTYVDPAVYGVNYHPLPPAPDVPKDVISRFAPQPGVYAISATPLQGIMTAQRDLYDWFRHREPDAQVGYGLLIFDVKPEEVQVDWVAQCITPVCPLPPKEIAQGEGKNLRIAYFDCTKAWLYPDAGLTPGHYIIARDDKTVGHPFVQSRLQSTSLAYEQRLPTTLPAFVIYRYAGEWGKALVPQRRLVRVAHTDWSMGYTLAHALLITAPVEMKGPLMFLGADVRRREETIEMDTHWRVLDSSGGRWLSVMAHLLSSDGHLIAGDDGMGVPIDQWRVGDTIVQHHVLALPPDIAPGKYWLQTGVYWLDSMERWSITYGGKVAGDRLIVGGVKVNGRD